MKGENTYRNQLRRLAFAGWGEVTLEFNQYVVGGYSGPIKGRLVFATNPKDGEFRDLSAQSISPELRGNPSTGWYLVPSNLSQNIRFFRSDIWEMDVSRRKIGLRTNFEELTLREREYGVVTQTPSHGKFSLVHATLFDSAGVLA